MLGALHVPPVLMIYAAVPAIFNESCQHPRFFLASLAKSVQAEDTGWSAFLGSIYLPRWSSWHTLIPLITKGSKKLANKKPIYRVEILFP